MRCVYCTFALCLLVGCQNQAIPLSNPFMSPDRVPPPATRTLLPGTAQPYYPGDQVPNLQPGTVVSPPYVPGTINTSPGSVVPTSPPGGWNPQPTTYPAQPIPSTPSPYQVNPASAEIPADRLIAVNESAVQIQSDTQNLRFNTAPTQTLANVEPLRSTIQNQSVVPAQFADVQPSTQAPWEPTPNISIADVVPREVTIRAITSSDSENVNNSSGFRPPSRDGFRPQGTRRRAGRANMVTENVVPNELSPARETVDRYGYDPQYRWLRGQLEFEPTSQQWQLRYLPGQGSSDQFGGRLSIANPVVLGNLQPGDHLQVQGRLDSRQIRPTTTVPVYTISAVQRQR